MKSTITRSLPIVVVLTFTCVGQGGAQNTKHVLDGTELADSFDMGVNTDKGRTDWLDKLDKENCFRLSYPTGQRWGAVFITVGPPVDPPRPSMDFSDYKFLVIEMKGGAGGEAVQIAVKANNQPDNGGEYKVAETLTAEWQTYKYPLARFQRADSKKLYVVAEFVFDSAPRTIYVRNIRYDK
jgi:hypothetical protein